MRERTLPVNTEKLKALSSLYSAAGVADRLKISRQLWNNYQKKHHDLPESRIDQICAEFKIKKSDLLAI